MNGQRHIARSIAGAAILAAGSALDCAPATAQTLRPAISDDGPLPRLRPRTAPRVAPPVAPVEAETPPPTNRARIGLPAGDALPVEETPTGVAEPEVDPAPTGLRPAVRDGILEPELEPQQPADGVIDEPEDYRNPDGADPVSWDSRQPEDADAFARPPAGNDPQAFTIEPTPLDDRRTSRLFRLEPWEPRGIRVGTFTIFPSVDLGAAWLSNLFKTKPARSDSALEVRPTLRAASNWRVHAFELRATGGFTFLDEFPKEDDRAYTLEARARLDVTRRTTLAASALRDVAQETRGTLENRLRGGTRADVVTDEGRLTFDHRFNRLAIQLRGVVQSRTYEDAAQDGLVAASSNRDRNLIGTEEAARFSWTFKPTLIGFVETATNQRRFEAPAADGIRRDSDGVRMRVGVGFGNTGQILRGEASIGYGLQTPLDRRLPAIDGIIIDANMAWRASALTTLLLRASADIVETSTPLSSGGLTQRYQAELRHAFMRPLIGTASASYATTAFQGIGITENQTDLGLGLEYYLGPEAILYGRYQHAIFRTNAPAPAPEWDADEVRIGMRLRR